MSRGMDESADRMAALAGVAVAGIAAALAAAAGAAPALVAVVAIALGVGAALIVPRLASRAETQAAGATPPASPAAEIRPAMRPGQAAELIAELPLPLILLDRQLRLRALNRAAVEMLGPAPAGEPLSSLLRASALGEAAAAVAQGGALRTVEFTHMRTREERVLRAHLRRTGAEDTDEAGVMVLIEDHTRMARLEQMRRDFIANAGHELKTPLASIAGFIETLMGPAADDPEAARRFLPIMARQAERMKRLVEDLTSLSRIEMNEHVRPTGRVELGALAHEVMQGMAPLAEAAGVTLEAELPETGLAVTGERDELAQLLGNLIDNAIKHGGPPGPVRLTLAAEEPGRRAMLGLTVSDRGPGIPREHIPRLTERFYRVPGGTRSVSGGKPREGTGLGLSIVKHILNRHRGELTIRARPGEGASFTAWLPRASSSAASADTAARPAEGAGHGRDVSES